MDLEWIEHHGKGYPDLPMDTLVQVWFADEETSASHGRTVEFWGVNWRWCDPMDACDIIAYRVVAK